MFETLSSMMKANGHTYIDVLKMDIEGFEYNFIDLERSILKNVGQWYVELHAVGQGSAGFNGYPRDNNALQYLALIEETDMRLFHKEHNFSQGPCCSEFSYIQRDWEKWELNKKSLSLER
jgi:Methyltransferase FkbM domain